MVQKNVPEASMLFQYSTNLMYLVLRSSHAPTVNGEDTSDDELGPNFGILNNLPSAGWCKYERNWTSVEQVTHAFRAYGRHHKGYVDSTFL